MNPHIAALLTQLHHPALPVVDLSLTRMEQLLAQLGNPQLRLPPVVHIAGTNGKGSTLAFLRAMLEADGKRVHVYTSPHLVRFNERIVLAGQEISDEVLLSLLQRVAVEAAQLPVTFFEATTASAFLAFAENPADLVLLETGLGGRLDATNVVPHPALTLITPIGFDHMEFLGNSLAKIAAEKAGILKKNVPCIAAQQGHEAAEMLRASAEVIDAPLMLADRDWDVESTLSALPVPALIGAHQRQNAALAVNAAQMLDVSRQAIERGIVAARWPGRLQKLTYGPLVEAWGDRGEVYLDGAHNVHGAEALAVWLTQHPAPTTLLFGMMQRKNVSSFISPLLPYLRELITVSISEIGAYDAESLAALIRPSTTLPIHSVNSLAAVACELQGKTQGRLLIAGSLFLAGEILKNHR